jgi:hypothetical protein
MRPQSQRIALSSVSHAASNISKRPARSRRRPFGIPSPAERTNKKTAGSHGTGSLDDRPHLLRQQVSSRAPPSPSSTLARTLARPIALAHQPPLPPLVAHSAPAPRSAATTLSRRPSSRLSLLPQAVSRASHALRRQRGDGSNRRRPPQALSLIALTSPPLRPQRLDHDLPIRPPSPAFHHLSPDHRVSLCPQLFGLQRTSRSQSQSPSCCPSRRQSQS